MLERLDAAVTAALTPLQGSMKSGAEDAIVQSQAEVGKKPFLYIIYIL